jgi:transposase InsO family protein
LRARPELARRREHCLMRMGRVLGYRVYQKRKAA